MGENFFFHSCDYNTSSFYILRMWWETKKGEKFLFVPVRTRFVRCWSGAAVVERAQERTKAPLSKSKRERKRFPGILIPGGASHLFFMPTASFSARHLHQRISFSHSILLRVNFSCRDIEIVVKKTYARWRAHSSRRIIPIFAIVSFLLTFQKSKFLVCPNYFMSIPRQSFMITVNASHEIQNEFISRYAIASRYKSS